VQVFSFQGCLVWQFREKNNFIRTVNFKTYNCIHVLHYKQIFNTKNYTFFKTSASGLFFKKCSRNYANFSLDILTKCILIYKKYCTSIAQDYRNIYIKQINDVHTVAYILSRSKIIIALKLSVFTVSFCLWGQKNPTPHPKLVSLGFEINFPNKGTQTLRNLADFCYESARSLS